MKGLKGRLLITPKCAGVAPFEIPATTDGEIWFCTATHDGVVYYYTGKTPESASNSYPADIVTVVEAHEVEYDESGKENFVGQKFKVGGDVYTVVGKVGDLWHLLSDTTQVMEDGLLKTSEELAALEKVC